MRFIILKGNRRFWEFYDHLQEKGKFETEEDLMIEAIKRLDERVEEEAKGRQIVSVPRLDASKGPDRYKDPKMTVVVENHPDKSKEKENST